MLTSIAIRDQVAWINMDDGKANAMSLAMLTELSERFEEAAASARVSVLTGRKGIFSAGFDLQTFKQGAAPAAAMVNAGIQLILKLLRHPHPVLAGCTGHAYPMGAFLMMSADRSIGVRGDFRLGMNEVAIGLTVPEFALALARYRLTAPGIAATTVGKMHAPEAALRLGYLDEVCQSNDLAAQLEAEARELLNVDLSSYVATKARLHSGLIREIEADQSFSAATLA